MHPVVQSVYDSFPPVAGERRGAIVALSGGADSVALLAAMVEVGVKVHAVHCNYHLRGDESVRDEVHARRVAAFLGVEITVVDCDVDRYRQEHRTMSVEMACRELRYKAFDEIAKSRGVEVIAVGHHLEDNLETMMLNLFRGSGVKGLSGMFERRNNIIRPFLSITKSDIVDYLRIRQLDFVTDSSNLSDDYRRNAIRNVIMPDIKRYFPGVEGGLRTTMTALSAQRRLIAGLVNRAIERYVDSQGNINVSLMVTEEPTPAELLFEMLNNPDYRGFTSDVAANIVRSVSKSGLSFIGSHGSEYRLEHGWLRPVSSRSNIIKMSFDSFDSPDVEHLFRVEVLKPAEFKPARDPNVAFFDADMIGAAAPFTLRQHELGDRMRPYGMKGSKLISDIFVGAKLSYNERLATPVVVDSGGRIIWLPGIRSSSFYAVTPATVSVLKITYLPLKDISQSI